MVIIQIGQPVDLLPIEEASNSPIRARWGEALNDGFVVVPSALLRHQYELKIDSGEAVVLVNLLMAWWKTNDRPFPRTSTLAKRMGVSLRTVQRHIEGLEEKGLIERIWDHTRPKDSRATPSYDLSGIVAKLKELGRNTHPMRQHQVAPGQEDLND